MIDQEVYDLSQTGDEVQAILNKGAQLPTNDQLIAAFALKADKSDTYTKAQTDAKAAEAANGLKSDLESGDVVPKMASNLENWEDRDDLSVEDEWTGQVRTTAGDQSINSEAGAKLISIVPLTD